jgi:hypothetical protein
MPFTTLVKEFTRQHGKDFLIYDNYTIDMALTDEDCAISYEMIVHLSRGTMAFAGRLSRMT